MNKEKIDIVIILIGVAAIILFASFDRPEPMVIEVKPSIYITRTDHARTFEGREVWILEYTVDGMFQAPAFDGPEALAEYREYLGAIGKVYQREEYGKDSK
jgi:hypothetical protein